MNFFERQERSRKNSRRLVVFFVLGVLAVLVAVNAVILTTWTWTVSETGENVIGDGRWFGSDGMWVMIWTSAVTLIVISAASVFKISSLSSGGETVARDLGGTRVPPDTKDPLHRRLHNVVEEMAIASGVPVPEVYVLESEPAINAFAAGYSPSDAVVAVTRGTLERLNRAELQGVVAHEFSHVFNGDMRLNIRLMGLMFGLLMIAIAGRSVLRGMSRSRSSSRKGNSGGPIIVAALGLMIVGYIGVFFGRLIKAAVSRQREFLADASAVQFTRDPDGIGGALKKIAGYEEGTHLVEADPEQVAHMLFGEGRSSWMNMLRTHPPIEKRIKAIDPSFNPESVSRPRRQRAQSSVDERLQAFSGVVESLEDSGLPIDADEIVRNIGNASSLHVQLAAGLIASIPQELRDIAHQDAGAPELTLALLLEKDRALRQRQYELIDGFDVELGEDVREIAETVLELKPEQRLPLMELAFPALRRRPDISLKRFADLVHELSQVDDKIEVFEYALARVLRTQIDELRHPPAQRQSAGKSKLTQVSGELVTLFSVLAQHGHEGDPEAARQAFLIGMHELLPGDTLNYDAPAQWHGAFDRALSAVDELKPFAKEQVITAMVKTIVHDRRITSAEAELLRATCAALHCPLPPLLQFTAKR